MADRGRAAAACERLVVACAAFTTGLVLAAAEGAGGAGDGAVPAIDEPQPATATAAIAAQGRVVLWRSLMAPMVIHRRLTGVGSRLGLR
jgi:hypothetical protein